MYLASEWVITLIYVNEMGGFIDHGTTGEASLDEFRLQKYWR